MPPAKKKAPPTQEQIDAAEASLTRQQEMHAANTEIYSKAILMVLSQLPKGQTISRGDMLRLLQLTSTQPTAQKTVNTLKVQVAMPHPYDSAFTSLFHGNKISAGVRDGKFQMKLGGGGFWKLDEEHAPEKIDVDELEWDTDLVPSMNEDGSFVKPIDLDDEDEVE